MGTTSSSKTIRVAWHEGLSVGVPAMDAQHREWLSILNDLYQAVDEHRGEEVLLATLEHMTEYTRVHFAAEEALLERIGFPDLESHRQQHRDFAAQCERLLYDMRGGARLNPKHMLIMIKGWLADHIMNEDSRYSDYAQPADRA